VTPDGQEGLDTAWLLLHPAAVPEAWLSRATPAVLLALHPSEATAMLRTAALEAAAAEPSVEERLRDLVAQGVPKARIAAALNISPRTLDRRLRLLRERFGARTLPELTAILARHAHGDERS
jgi:DNA-binding CsgD family transcriptional regulator